MRGNVSARSATRAPAGRSRASGPAAAPPEYRCSVGRDEVPGGEPVLLRQVGEEPVAFIALDRRSPEPAAPVPPAQPIERPSAEAAVARRRARRVAPWRQRTCRRCGAGRGGRAGSPGSMRHMYLDVFDRNPYGTNCWLLAAEAREEAVVVDPGFEPDDVRRCSRRAGQTPGRGPADARASRPRRRRRRVAGDDVPVFVHPADAVAFDDLGLGRAGFDNPLEPVKDLRTIVDGDVLSSRRASDRGGRTPPGTRPGHCCFVTTTTSWSSPATSCSPARSAARTSRTPTRGDADEPRRFLTLPDDAADVLPGHGPRDDGRAGARVEPVPGGPGLMDLAPPRGTQDLLPPAGSRMRALYDRAARRSRACTATATWRRRASRRRSSSPRTSGETSDVVAKEMYTFQDRGDRSLTLRPEGTAPVMRAYLDRSHDLPTPFKSYYLTRMYRYARPQAGRYREHRQFGVEVFGTEAPGADVEVIALGDAVPARARARAVRAPAELDRRRRLPPRLPRGADRVPRAEPRPPERRAPGPVRGQPAAGPRLQGRGVPGRRAGGAAHHRPPLRSVRDALRGGARGLDEAPASTRSSRRRSSAASTTTRGRRSSSSSHGSARRSRRRCSAGAATTGSPRRSAGRTSPASGSAWVSSACCSRSRRRGSRRPSEPRARGLRGRRRRRRRAHGRARSSRELRDGRGRRGRRRTRTGR